MTAQAHDTVQYREADCMLIAVDGQRLYLMAVHQSSEP